jgi:excisionase family DNA binding protein
MHNRSQAVAAELAIMTVKEVAEYLRVSEAKVYRLVKEGALPVARIGKAWRFRRDLLDEWLKDGTRNGSDTSKRSNDFSR